VIPLGPCVCGHRVSQHGDRAYGPCLREDAYASSTIITSMFGGIAFRIYPTCGTCKGYKEDLGATHKLARKEARWAGV